MSSIMNIIQRVKDKRKQIHVKLRQVSLSQVMEYSQLFEGIHRVSIILSDSDTIHPLTLNFNVFNNIYQVELYQFCNITTINDGFHNVNTLIIDYCRDLREIHNINNDRSLRKIIITECDFLSEFNLDLEGIETVEIQSRRLHRITSSLNSLKQLSIISQVRISSELMEAIYKRAPFIQSLKLQCKLPPNFTLLKDIPHLTLFPRNSIEYTYPIPFSNEALSLSSFDLATWNQISYAFGNVRKLYLKGITGLIDFPIMPNLRELSLTSCHTLTSIPSLEKLVLLKIRICRRLTSVAEIQPSLRIVELQQVPIKDFAFIYSNFKIKKVILKECLVKNVSDFVKVPILSIDHCSLITSLAGLAGKSFEEDRRIIKLIELNNITDFSVLYNIYDLTLIEMKGLTNGEGIHNIHHLSIRDCSNLLSTNGLSRITSSLFISQCKNLLELVNIHGIPMIKIEGKDFDSNIITSFTFKDHKEVNIKLFQTWGPNRNVIYEKGERIVSLLKPAQRELNIQQLIIKCNEKVEVSVLE
eukprot:gene7600-8205_t